MMVLKKKPKKKPLNNQDHNDGSKKKPKKKPSKKSTKSGVNVDSKKTRVGGGKVRAWWQEKQRKKKMMEIYGPGISEPFYLKHHDVTKSRDPPLQCEGEGEPRICTPEELHYKGSLTPYEHRCIANGYDCYNCPVDGSRLVYEGEELICKSVRSNKTNSRAKELENVVTNMNEKEKKRIKWAKKEQEDKRVTKEETYYHHPQWSRLIETDTGYTDVMERHHCNLLEKDAIDVSDEKKLSCEENKHKLLKAAPRNPTAGPRTRTRRNPTAAPRTRTRRTPKAAPRTPTAATRKLILVKSNAEVESYHKSSNNESGYGSGSRSSGSPGSRSSGSRSSGSRSSGSGSSSSRSSASSGSHPSPLLRLLPLPSSSRSSIPSDYPPAVPSSSPLAVPSSSPLAVPSSSSSSALSD